MAPGSKLGQLVRTWNRPGSNWPKYLPGGRMRTSTLAMLVAFVALSWIHQTYQPTPAPAPQTAQVVPPGYMPDPNYTWVPRTNVQTRPRTTYSTPTTTTTTETTPPSETTSETTSPTSSGPAPTTVVDPDGPGPLPPTTLTSPPSSPTSPPTTSPTSSPALPVPNRSGTSTTTTTFAPGPGTAPTTPAAPG